MHLHCHDNIKFSYLPSTAGVGTVKYIKLLVFCACVRYKSADVRLTILVQLNYRKEFENGVILAKIVEKPCKDEFTLLRMRTNVTIPTTLSMYTK